MDKVEISSPLTSRRKLIKSAAVGFAGINILPSSMLWGDQKPSEQFRFLQVGIGGKGRDDLNGTIRAGGKLVAMCDVDKVRAEPSLKKYPGIPLYADYRKAMDKHQKEIDAVVVTTPDHMHGAIALEAIKRGKHVYVQKPLARTYQECEVLWQAAKKYKVITQMGNQGHSGNGLKLWQQMTDEKVFGDIEHIHTWSNRPFWPQGMKSTPKKDAIPSTLNWNEWLGVAKMRDFSKAYLPFNWRGWWDFGCGAMGDMACHNMDPAFWIFKLGMPSSVKVRKASSVTDIAYPNSSIIDYTFDHSPVTGKPIKLSWYDGQERPNMPEGSHPKRTAGDNGCMVVGSKLSAKGGVCAGRPLPISITGEKYGDTVKDLERHWRAQLKNHTNESHYAKWVNAVKAGKPRGPGSDFDYAVPFTQAILLGCIALRYPGQELKWDDKKKEFSNFKEANQWLSMTPRKGYSLSL